MSDPADEFRKRLDLFVFFHLGADAAVSLETTDSGGIEVRIGHHRVHPFSFILDSANLAKLAEDGNAFEEYMLDLLVRYRRGS